jgi:hypothetical protein
MAPRVGLMGSRMASPLLRAIDSQPRAISSPPSKLAQTRLPSRRSTVIVSPAARTQTCSRGPSNHSGAALS